MEAGWIGGVLCYREARDADSEALIELITDCWSAYPGCVMDVDGEEPWLRAPASAYERYGGRLWVVESEGSVVACCGLKPLGGGVVELKSMYVGARARRQGIASELAKRVEAEARARGANRIELWSDTRFGEAHAFYQAKGFHRLPGSRDLHDRSDTTEYPFAKELP